MSERLDQILSKVNKRSDAAKAVSGSVNPLQFESDLVAALNGEKSLSKYQSLGGQRVAVACASALTSVAGKITKARRVARSGVDGKAVLSPMYKRFMCGGIGRCNGDSKSDLVCSSQMNGVMQVSLKKAGAAQIASAQAGEINAVLSAALEGDKQYLNTVRNIVKSTLDRESYYKIRNQYSYENPQEPFDAVISRMIGLQSKTGLVSAAEIREFNKFLGMIGVREKITKSLQEFMSSPPIREKILREFASGENRYNSANSEMSADWFLTWDEGGKVELMDIDQFVKKTPFRMNIRDRGNGGGGSLRIDIRESEEYKRIVAALNEEWEFMCLTEGVLDTTLGMIRSAGKAVADLYRAFVQAVKGLVQFIAALVLSGFSTLMEWVGIEVDEMSYTWI